jgi:hypothetical protein
MGEREIRVSSGNSAVNNTNNRLAPIGDGSGVALGAFRDCERGFPRDISCGNLPPSNHEDATLLPSHEALFTFLYRSSSYGSMACVSVAS